MYCKVSIVVTERPDGSGLFGAVNDEVKINCGDFSEERLNAYLSDVNRRIVKAWRYLSDRNSAEE